jgi:copper chaperone
MEVLVFKTNVKYKKEVSKVADRLSRFNDINRWNFDLQDSDRILRIEAAHLSPKLIETTLQEAGYFCEELPD